MKCVKLLDLGVSRTGLCATGSSRSRTDHPGTDVAESAEAGRRMLGR